MKIIFIGLVWWKSFDIWKIDSKNINRKDYEALFRVWLFAKNPPAVKSHMSCWLNIYIPRALPLCKWKD